ncbi:hypothetical protein B0H67DRAFT_59062 [Lasiosphaeris hirsuta]|uniref:Uncharacterized protein n=1 Tax=Lasiosphaeris hirsuta TaxID=260670 RepID=A0AA40E8S0_9PEZI|nr:hypothetical protein B0H67DRAFT_59062 [Lasiosphaeris hirsuta]
MTYPVQPYPLWTFFVLPLNAPIPLSAIYPSPFTSTWRIRKVKLLKPALSSSPLSPNAQVLKAPTAPLRRPSKKATTPPKRSSISTLPPCSSPYLLTSSSRSRSPFLVSRPLFPVSCHPAQPVTAALDESYTRNPIRSIPSLR